MQTTRINPAPPNQYFRKVKADGTFKKTFKVLGLYFTVSNCRVKKRITCGYTRRGADADKIIKTKLRVYESNDGRCPLCGGRFDYNRMELHHVLPVARFGDLLHDERNMMLLCHGCHKEVHCNPWLNIRLMQEKAKEIGIELKDRYDYGEEDIE